MTITLARAEIMAEIQTIEGIRMAPDGVPEKAQFPFAVSFADNGRYEFFNDAQYRAFHNITLEIHVEREPDLERRYNTMEPFIDLIPKHLQAKLKTREWQTIQTWAQIDYDVTPSQWNGVKTLAVKFVLRNVKVVSNYD